MPARKKFDKLEMKPEYSEKTDVHGYSVRKKSDDTAVSFSFNNKKDKVPSKKATYSFRPAFPFGKSDKLYAVGFIHVYVPFLVSFALSLIVMFLTKTGAFDGIGDTALLILRCVIYPVSFVLPGIVYCRYYKKSILKESGVHRFSAAFLPFIILSTLLLVFAAATVRLTICHLFPAQTNTDIYFADNSNLLLTLLAYSVFPAICEGFLLWGLMRIGISEIAGGITGITVCALAFALINFDLRYFAVYLCAGIVLAVCAHVTNSVIPSVCIHILSSIISLFFSARLSFIASERSGSVLVIIIFAIITFLILLFYIKSLENICIKKAYLEDAKKADEKDTESVSQMCYATPFRLYSTKGYTLHKFLRVLFSPAIIISVIIYLFASV